MTTRHLHTAARGLVAMLVAAAVSSGIGTPGAAPMAADVDGLAFAEEAAIRAAVDRVARSVVRIESAGVSATGLASAGEATPATGPSTGLVVEEGGWVLTTSFAVPTDVDEAIVVMPSESDPGGPPGPRSGAAVSRRVARVVGRDLARGIVLLRIDATADAGALPAVSAWVPRTELAVGQWTIAVGRVWSVDVPSVAVGILSATNRSWGRSVQTDASVSPANYGGPLIDIHGRVIGVLAPLPADTAGMNLGTELYDSGIGFAVPFEDLRRVLPRLKEGKTLAAGVLGIGYTARDPFTGEARIATVRPGSPAARAGLRPGDAIVAAGGRAVTRIAELRHVLAPLYAGDTVTLTVERAAAAEGGAAARPERLDLPVELVASLPPWQRPAVGIVPVRSGSRDPKRGPVEVAWVWPEGPAARAGIRTGDRVEGVIPAAAGDGAAASGDMVAVDSAAALAGLIAGGEVGRPLAIVVTRQGVRQTIPVEAAAMPTAIPADLGDWVPSAAPAPGGEAASVERLEGAEVAQPPLAVLPATDPQQPVGVVVYCDLPRGPVTEQQAAEWKAAAARHGVAVIVPGSTDPQRWGREDIAGIRRAIATLASRRAIDPARVAVAGRGAGAAFAWLVAEALGPVVRGVVLVDAALPRQAKVEPAEPGRSRWVVFGGAIEPQSPLAARIEADRQRLREAGMAVGDLPVVPGVGTPPAVVTAWVEALGLL